MQARIGVKEGSYNEGTEDSTLWSHLTIVLIQHPPKWITLSQILPHSLHTYYLLIVAFEDIKLV